MHVRKCALDYYDIPSFMFILSIMLPNLFIPDVPFPALLSTLIRRRFQVKPVTLLIPIKLYFFPLVEKFYQRGLSEAQNGYTFCMLLGQVAITCTFQVQLCYVEIPMQLSLKHASYGHLPQQPRRERYFLSSHMLI